MKGEKRDRYGQEFRLQAVQRMNAGDNVRGLSWELGIHERPLTRGFKWCHHLDTLGEG
jgi:transposase-like protein